MTAAIVGVILGVVGWVRNKEKEAEHRGALRNTLEMIARDLKDTNISIEKLSSKIDLMDDAQNNLEVRVARLEENFISLERRIRELERRG